MCSVIDFVQPSGKHVFCDRFCTTIPLIEHLAQTNISLTGTINPKVKFSSDKQMKAKGRGSMEQFITKTMIMNRSA